MEKLKVLNQTRVQILTVLEERGDFNRCLSHFDPLGSSVAWNKVHSHFGIARIVLSESSLLTQSSQVQLYWGRRITVGSTLAWAIHIVRVCLKTVLSVILVTSLLWDIQDQWLLSSVTIYDA